MEIRSGVDTEVEEGLNVMPSVDVYDIQRQKVRSIELKPEVFGSKPNAPLVYEAVVMQRASGRQGTASTRRRGEVSGSGKKPWKQKHTGRARVGSIRSPLWRHGGTVFGPKPRGYGYALPQKKYRAAMRSALSAKFAGGGILVVSDLPLGEAKTRILGKALKQLGLQRHILIVVGEDRPDVEQAARNLRGVKVIRPQGLNIYDVLRYDSIVILEGEVARLQEVWS